MGSEGATREDSLQRLHFTLMAFGWLSCMIGVCVGIVATIQINGFMMDFLSDSDASLAAERLRDITGSRSVHPSGVQSTTAGLMPLPKHMTASETSKAMPLTVNFKVEISGPSNGRVRRAVQRLLHRLWMRTGLMVHQGAHSEDICQNGHTDEHRSQCTAAPFESTLVVAC